MVHELRGQMGASPTAMKAGCSLTLISKGSIQLASLFYPDYPDWTIRKSLR